MKNDNIMELVVIYDLLYLSLITDGHLGVNTIKYLFS